MYLGCYAFDGDPDELRAAYDRLMAMLPPDAVDLNVCVATAEGLRVYDACPSQDVFEGFSTGPDFLAAVEAAGLPAARVEGLGDVHRARLAHDIG